jgi:hypothetical protein
MRINMAIRSAHQGQPRMLSAGVPLSGASVMCAVRLDHPAQPFEPLSLLLVPDVRQELIDGFDHPDVPDN